MPYVSVSKKNAAQHVMCFQNISISTIFITLIIVAIAYLFFAISKTQQHQQQHQQYQQQPSQCHNTVIKEECGLNGYGGGGGIFGGGGGFGFGMFSRPNYGYTNLPNDVLLNPYIPPLKDDRYLIPNIAYVPAGAVPINVSTNIGAVDTAYRQVGILTPENNSPNKILSLMGRPLFKIRDKWQFYTMTKNNIKLPITKNGRSCTNEHGCDNIYSRDVVYVE